MRTPSYEILTDTDPVCMSAKVTAKLQDGYMVCGGLVVVGPMDVVSGFAVYIQAVVKRNPAV